MKEVNGLMARFRRNPSDENQQLLDTALGILREKLNEVLN